METFGIYCMNEPMLKKQHKQQQQQQHSGS